MSSSAVDLQRIPSKLFTACRIFPPEAQEAHLMLHSSSSRDPGLEEPAQKGRDIPRDLLTLFKPEN